MNKVKRVLIKISGEALGCQTEFYHNEKIANIVDQIKVLLSRQIEVALVVGGGNIWRGRKQGEEIGLDRINADYVGMLGTVMNALVLESKLKALGLPVIVQSALEVNKIAEPYYYKKAIRRLEKGYVVIFAGGTGYPYFTTDSCAALRGAEIKADLLLMAKNGVDGVYDKDPKVNNDAVHFQQLTYDEMNHKQLKVMDLTASTMALEANLKMVVFDINQKNNILKALDGKTKFTVISKQISVKRSR